jgi:hypothetical protein
MHNSKPKKKSTLCNKAMQILAYDGDFDIVGQTVSSVKEAFFGNGKGCETHKVKVKVM